MSWLDVIRAWFLTIWSSIPQDFKDRMMDAVWSAMEAAAREFYRAWKAQRQSEEASHEKP